MTCIFQLKSETIVQLSALSGCLFIATNLDHKFPSGGKLYPGKDIPYYPMSDACTGGGTTVAPIITSVQRDPLVVGKPERLMLDIILSRCL